MVGTNLKTLSASMESLAPQHTPRVSNTAQMFLVVGIALSLVAYAILLAGHIGGFASGSDSSGYLNNARLMHEGHMRVAQRIIAGLPSDKLSPRAYVPLGFVPVGRSEMVPTYPIGLSLLIAGIAPATGWDAAAYATMWLHALFGIVLMFALARQAGLSLATGALGALLLAASPLYLFMSLQVMSDVPALVWCAAGVLFTWRSRRSTRWALAAGASIAIAVLVRPTDLLILAPIAVSLGFAWRRWAWLALGGAPGAVFLTMFNKAVYGRIITTGYGGVGSSFSDDFILLSLANYAHWLPVILTPAVILVLTLPWTARHESGRLAATLATWIAAFVGFYSFYYNTHETWWYLRFLLPAFPAFILAMLLAGRALAAHWTIWTRCAAAVVAAGSVVTWDSYWIERTAALDSGDGERSYFLAAEWVRTHLPTNAVVVVMQASGTMFYYTDFTLLRYDTFSGDAGSAAFSEVEDAAIEGGRPIYAVLYPFEVKEALETRVPGHWMQTGAVREWTIWRLAGRDAAPVPDVPWREFFSARLPGTDISARVADGWLGIEHDRRHTWTWCSGRGSMEFVSLTRSTNVVQLEFVLRSVAPCIVTLIQDGTTLWCGPVNIHRTPVSIPVQIRGGYARLYFSTDMVPLPEGQQVSARLLTFAVYDPNLSLPGHKQ